MSNHDGEKDPEEISVLQDEQGIAFFGDSSAISKWLDERGISSRDIKLRTARGARLAGQAIRSAADISAQSGRWVKLTRESASLVAKYGSNSAVQSGVVRSGGKIFKHLKFEGAGSLANPALATSVAGMMTQMALEQSIQEITDYLEEIDAKIDLILQDQKDQAISKLLGIKYLVNEAHLIYERLGSIPDTTWSKLAGCPQDLAQTQSYALLKIDGLAKRLEESRTATEIQKATQDVRDEIQQWLEISAEIIRLQDELSVLELNRCLTDDSETVQQLKSAILEAKNVRQREIEAKNNRLAQQIEKTASWVREKKLLHPFAVDDSLQNLDKTMKQLQQFAKLIDIQTASNEISNAPSWNQVAGQLLGEKAEEAKQLGDKTAFGAKRLQSVVVGKAKSFKKPNMGIGKK